MRLALVLSLVSSLQIFQQSAVERKDFETVFEYSVVTAAFPIGKFIATIFLSIHHVELHSELDRCAKLLVFGAVVSLVPYFTSTFQFAGRLLMGFSAGSGFILAPSVLRLAVPENMRPTNFMFLAAAFSFGTFLANSMFFVENLMSPVLFSAFLAAGSGILYLLLRPSTYPTEEILIKNDGPPEALKSKNPYIFVFVLMLLNVSIGVPLLQSYSTLIFKYYGISELSSRVLSMIFPILQFFPVFISMVVNVSRKTMIIGGYLASVMAQFCIMITSVYKWIPEQHQTYGMATFLIVLAVAFAAPCNTGLCILFEQFEGGDVKTASKSRCIMWFFASVGTLTFAKTLSSWGFTLAFLPYFLTSFVCFFAMISVFPSGENGGIFKI